VFNFSSLRISGGIWLLITEEAPAFEGFDELLPTNLLRGFVALDFGFVLVEAIFCDQFQIRENSVKCVHLRMEVIA
jgi:hypothetical protein